MIESLPQFGQDKDLLRLDSTRLFLLLQSKLLNFFNTQSLSIVVCPNALDKASIWDSFSFISSLYFFMLTAFSNANEAFSKNCFFHCWTDFGSISYLDASSFIVVLPSKSSKIAFVLNSGEKILKLLTHKISQLNLNINSRTDKTRCKNNEDFSNLNRFENEIVQKSVLICGGIIHKRK